MAKHVALKSILIKLLLHNLFIEIDMITLSYKEWLLYEKGLFGR